MARKRSKKIKNRRVAAPTIGSVLRADWPEIMVEGLEGAAEGAGAGVLVSVAFGVGDISKNALIGGGAGLVIQAAKGTAVCHRRRSELVDMSNAALDTVADMFAEMSEMMEDEVGGQVGSVVAEFLAKAGLGSDRDEDEEEEEPKAQAKGGKGKQQARA